MVVASLALLHSRCSEVQHLFRLLAMSFCVWVPDWLSFTTYCVSTEREFARILISQIILFTGLAFSVRLIADVVGVYDVHVYSDRSWSPTSGDVF